MVAQAIFVIIQLIILEGILSIDNAAVMAAMTRKLPQGSPSPWPVQLLGKQPQAALKAGLLAAIVGRWAMIYGAEQLTRVSAIKLIAGAYLAYLMISHFWKHFRKTDQDQASKRGTGHGFWRTVAAVEFADLSFSLDNVLAAVALSDKIVFIMIGVAIGMVCVRFAAVLFQRIMAHIPEVEHAAYAMIGAIGIELGIKHFWKVEINETIQFCISAAIMGIAIGTNLLRRLKTKNSLRDNLPSADKTL